MSDAIPAATLILVRERPSAGCELLMVERARTMAFAGGAWVFPGGRIDPDDVAFAATIAPDMADAAARIAAIRETVEEAGVAVGFRADPPLLATVRARLHAGAPFARVLADSGATLDLSALTPFTRWRPAHSHARIFDTHFFLAAAPADVAAQVDGTENTRLTWITASAMLARAATGDASVIYPTRRTLERLAGLPSFASARADALAHPVRTITPFVERRDGVDHLCIPDGLGYPVTSEPLTDAVRG